MKATTRLYFLAGTVSLLGIGCGAPAGPARQPVAGTVTLDGKPLDSGTITFLPSEGGPGAFGPIQAGAFQFSAADGPPAGRYRVEIVAVKPTGKQIPDPDGLAGTIAEVRNTIPPRYNARTELEAEVKADTSNAFPFQLSTRKAKVGTRTASR